jgi:hypothetical protein
VDELLLTLKSSKNKRAPGSHEMNIELIKGIAALPFEIVEIVNTCWKTGSIPDE